MLFSTAQSEVAESLGLDISNVDTQTKIQRWLNLSYQDIVGKYNWSWLKIYTTVTLAIDYTTGTASVTSGSATVTFSSTIATSQVNRYIQFSSAKSWYKITAHTAGTATATISPVYAPATDLSAGTFIIRTIFYELPSTVEYVVGVRQTTYPLSCEIMDRTRYNEFVWWSNMVGATRAIIPNGLNSSGNWEFTPYPFPNDAYILEFYCIKRITELSAASDTPIFPARFNSIWIQGAIAYGYQFLDDTRYGDSFVRFSKTVEEMFKRDNPAQNQHYVTKPMDQIPANRGLMLPSEYGPNTGL